MTTGNNYNVPYINTQYGQQSSSSVPIRIKLLHESVECSKFKPIHMNTHINIYILSFLALLVIFSCNTAIDSNSPLDIVAVHTLTVPSEAATTEKITPSALTKKWTLGDDYIDLESDDSFDAFLGRIQYQGKWGLSNDRQGKRTLKLIGYILAESTKKSSFDHSYELINVSYDRLVAIDTEGNKINFSSEKK